MNNKDFFESRSIELAERAYRQKARATSDEIKAMFDDAADELIRLENPYRFYDAQTKLEVNVNWSEEKRALAHELNVVNKLVCNEADIDYDQVMKILEEWVQILSKNSYEEGKYFDSNFQKAVLQLHLTSSSDIKKQSLNYILSALEVMLNHINYHTQTGKLHDNFNVKLIRNMRDTVLTTRLLQYDDLDLLNEDAKDEPIVNQLIQTREELEEIYRSIESVDIPKDL